MHAIIGVVPCVAVLASGIVFMDFALVYYLDQPLCEVLLDMRIVLDVVLVLGR